MEQIFSYYNSHELKGPRIYNSHEIESINFSLLKKKGIYNSHEMASINFSKKNKKINISNLV